MTVSGSGHLTRLDKERSLVLGEKAKTDLESRLTSGESLNP